MILFLTNRIFFNIITLVLIVCKSKFKWKRLLILLLFKLECLTLTVCILEEQKCSYGKLMVHDFKFIFKKKIFTFVMVLNTSCILLFMTVRHNKAVSTHYETDYVYRHKRESFSVANWLQLLSNDQWGPKFEYIFYK